MDVSTRRAALVRVFAGGNGRKNDDTDAHSIALVGLHRPDLPEVHADDRRTALWLLSNRGRELIGQRAPGVCIVCTVTWSAWWPGERLER